MERLGAPDVFATQLLFLYRYIFVLGEEAMSMTRARALRSFGGRGMGMRVYGLMLGHLLLRTYDRAQRVYLRHAQPGFRRPDPGRCGVCIWACATWSSRSVGARPSRSSACTTSRLLLGQTITRADRVSHHSIEVSELGFAYPDGPPALDGVSFRITHGESVAVVGANGAGKSTLLMHLNGVLTPARAAPCASATCR